MTKTSIIKVGDKEIALTRVNKEDYVSLTDMVKGEEGDDHIRNWMRNKNTIEFLGFWEKLNNPDFKGVEFDTFLQEAGFNRFTMTPRKWIDSTNAIGIVSKSGRNGGTYAHKDIALEFAYWISPVFRLYLITEFQRLKEEENKNLKSIEWIQRRFISKANYSLQTDAIQKFIIPKSTLPVRLQGIEYANEAELINLATLKYTAKEWSEANPELAKKGNLREYLPLEELVVLDNMQVLNSTLISKGLSKNDRFELIRLEAERQLNVLSQNKTITNAKELSVKKDDFDQLLLKTIKDEK